jgi:ABC-2 type transport system permease protein
VADVDAAKLPGVLEQIWLIAGLRWRILKNSLRRKHNVWDLIAMIWVGFLSGVLALGVAFALAAASYVIFHSGKLGWLASLYWAIFLWWQILPVFVAGFGSNFEFATLLRFPLSLRAFYLLGLGYGFSDYAALSSVCWIIGIISGAAQARADVVPMMLAVSSVFVLLNVTMERLLGSWMEKIFAKRRSREIFIGIFILSMVSLNFLNPGLHKWEPTELSRYRQYLGYLWWTPGSLAGAAIRGFANADARAALVGLGGLFVWVAALSVLLWRRFAAQYSGEEISDSPGPVILRRREKKQIIADEAPEMLAPQVAAVIMKEFRYLTRNGMAFVQLIIPPLMVVFFTMQFGKGSPLKEHAIKPAVFFPGILAYLMLILVSPAYNSFAYEGKGIQTYFMAPVRFRDVLLGKNLFLVALVGLELVLALGMLTFRVGWPGMPMFLATITAGAFALSGQLAIANWSSLSFPKKMEIGKMKGQRNSGVAVWTAFGVQILVGGICAVILMAGRWTGNPWLPPIAFTALCAAAIGGYISSLDAMDRLAESKKELLIETLSK